MLLNDIGGLRRPKVVCVGQLADVGAGHPDFGLFTVTQISAKTQAPKAGVLPERGVVEAKPPTADLMLTARSRQVQRYWERYGLVLVTNYREFLIVGRDQFGRATFLEHFRLADTVEAFWTLAAGHARLDPGLETRFTEFLTRALLHNATLSQPRDVAWLLASYARDTLARLEQAARAPGGLLGASYGPPQLEIVRKTLEEALGIVFEGEKGAHFFRSTLVQTLYYGLFSAWVLWCRQHDDPAERKGFSAMGAAWHLRLPVLRTLFENVCTPGALGSLEMGEVLDWAAHSLCRVDDRAFFARFSEEHAVQYFYEPFLEAFDPDLRRQLGVWYTPPEVVDYMVARVDRVLRDDLGIPRGLADDRVVVLDPCCGTGSYLVAVLRRIERTLKEMGEDALAGHFVKRAAIGRVHGFEIMPAPFVVAHLQLGLLLESMGAPLAEEGAHTAQRAEWPSIRLTNALTGWDGNDEHPDIPYLLSELMNERDAASRIKQDSQILVILGNPPYNAFPGTAEMPEERALTEAYRRVRRVRPPEGHGLNDLYVRFFRMAERRIAETSGRGIVAYVTNYSWLDGLSHTGMRERFLEAFDTIWIDCLNGDKFKTGKVTPDGKPDPSIFSTGLNREGIGVGTAITLMVRRDPHGDGEATIRFRHLWGTGKWRELSASADNDGVEPYEAVEPDLGLGLRFIPGSVRAGYTGWPSLMDLFAYSSPGVKTSRDISLVDIDLDRLQQRIGRYFDANYTLADLAHTMPELVVSRGRFDAKAIREALLPKGVNSGVFVRYGYRPFDTRNLYWHPETKLLDEKRDSLSKVSRKNTLFLTTRQKAERGKEGSPFFVTRALPDWHLTRPGSICIPLRDETEGTGKHLFSSIRPEIQRANLTPSASAYLDAIGGPEYLTEPGADAHLWMHCLAIGHAPAYLAENADGLSQDFPRIPLPSTRAGLEASAALGRRVADLLDVDSAVVGVTELPLRRDLRVLGALRDARGERFRAEGGKGMPPPVDLRVQAGWGRAGQNGVCMPGRGDARPRPQSDDERAALGEAAALLGDTVYDVHLNGDTYWCCVPAPVWEYTLGGYQVLKKWLSYREYSLLGRPLTAEEARYVTAMVRRITALLLLGPALDANYRAVAGNAYARGTEPALALADA
ncbi:type ISP restriction/modification enzyme [Azospirillum sp.]|uniref:type ISP restriction/modification enzyme n=1 Tax=Azospirillum sp. TaxID=34012 RepID=UPI002D3D6AAF|nr:type ISP restriction/modification enzyme [Azospirillum sp.]HYD70249.1 type ISP restriction/modification enzyme [Azospirillum sp.]